MIYCKMFGENFCHTMIVAIGHYEVELLARWDTKPMGKDSRKIINWREGVWAINSNSCPIHFVQNKCSKVILSQAIKQKV